MSFQTLLWSFDVSVKKAGEVEEELDPTGETGSFEQDEEEG